MHKQDWWVVLILSPLIIFVVVFLTFLSSVFVRTMINKWEVSSLEHKIEMAKLEASAAYYEKNK